LAEIKIFQKLVNYPYGIEIMYHYHRERVEKKIDDTFLILEHEPVFTLGKRGGRENIIIKNDIPVYETERGGNITYHGPGQIMIYPVIDLKKLKMGVKEYVTRLEDIVIELFREFGVDAGRNCLNRGVWVLDKKVSSVGVLIRRGITLHGIAVNINNSLEPFKYINPCGLRRIEISSLEEQINDRVELDFVKNRLKNIIKKTFPECFFD